MFGCILICLVIGMLAYIRLAPTKTERWHVPISFDADTKLKGGSARIIEDTGDSMKKLNKAMIEQPRTTILAGSSDQGFVTYVTRSKWIGFPDYTTIQQTGGQIKMFARLRFGRRDFGVNAVRLKRIISTLD